MHLAAFFALVLSATVAYGGEVYRWTDEYGRIHYGDSVPDSQKRQAKTIDMTCTTMTDAQRQEAEARLAREKALLRKNSKLDPSPTSSTTTSDTTDTRNMESKCEEQWRKYEESYACFNPYRLAHGGVKAEAYEHCTEVKRPERCN